MSIDGAQAFVVCIRQHGSFAALRTRALLKFWAVQA
jgi:hypothetical protein